MNRYLFMSLQQHCTRQMNLSHYTSSPSFCHNFNIVTKHCYQSLSLGMECWCKRIPVDSESVWCQTCMILDLLASRNRRNDFLLLTLQCVVFCNSSIKPTKTSPSQMVSQSKKSLLKIFLGSLTWEHRKEDLIEPREPVSELCTFFTVGPHGSFSWGFMEQLIHTALGKAATWGF